MQAAELCHVIQINGHILHDTIIIERCLSLIKVKQRYFSRTFKHHTMNILRVI
jgi:hypothetical protein